MFVMGRSGPKQGLLLSCALFGLITHVSAQDWHPGLQDKFDQFVDLADTLYAETNELEASLYLLRAALQLCPNCTAPDQQGHLSQQVFSSDANADTRLLLDTIIPALAPHSPQHILWFGVQAHTLRALYGLKSLNATVTSIEPDASQAAYGADNHIIASFEKLQDHVPSSFFDVIIINGLLGWESDGDEAVEKAVQSMYQVLVNGGLVIRWNEGTESCCDFDPWFHHRVLGGLPAITSVPNSAADRIFEFLRRNEYAYHIMWPSYKKD